MVKKVNLDIFQAISEVLKVVDINDFIKYIYSYKDNYKKSNFQDIVIQKIISTTCQELSISENDVLHTKFNHNGKRVMAFGIIGMFIKTYFPHLSFERICVEFKNNVDSANLRKYIKPYKEFDYNSDKPFDLQTKNILETINNKILIYIQNERQ